MIATLFWICTGSVLYTYAGYPALLTLLARFRREPGPFPAAEPPVTLLIAAYNEEAEIARKIENSLELDYPRDKLQILIVADGSSDRTPEIAGRYADRGVELMYSPPRKGKMAAINRAMPHARGEIVVFSDANNRYEANVIRELVAPFADPRVGAVSGAKVIEKGDGALGESEGLYWRYESFVKKQETKLAGCTAVAGEVLALRRELFESPPDEIINDDTHMGMRIIKRGYRIHYAPNARSYERVSASAQDEVARRARIFAGRYQAIAYARELWPTTRPVALWQILSHQTLRTLVAVAMAGSVITNLLAVILPRKGSRPSLWRLTAPFNWLMLAAQAVFYGLAWIGGRTNSASTLGRIAYLPTFLVNSNWAGLIGLYRFIRRRQTTLWQRVGRRTNS